jgi:tripartite-type tricarboxylate transporter receptor subunit TctC
MIPLRCVLLALGLLVAARPAVADELYPTRPVSIVVPFPPGGIADVTARPLAAALERRFKQPVVVTNKAGAAGAVGMQSVAVAKPEGYTLLLGLVSISIIPEVHGLFGRPPASPAARELLNEVARRAGTMRPLATWGSTRLAAFPEAPTLKELGYDVEYYLWAGLFVPRGAPAGVVKALRDATRQAVADPEFKAAMDKVQTPIAYQDADEFKAWWDRDARTLAEVVKRIGRVETK